jgi:serine protease
LKYSVILLLLTALILGSARTAQSQNAGVVAGEVLFQVTPDARPEKIEQSFRELTGILPGFRAERCISTPMRAWLGTFEPDAISLEEVIRTLHTIPGVVIAQPNHLLEMRETVPDDPFFGNQWYHRQDSDRDIDSDLAWDITTGGGTLLGDEIVVCVIEPNGAKWDQPDILPNHWVNPHEIENNGIDDDGNGYVDDYHGYNITNGSDDISSGSHGTQVSSMIGAKGNNTQGIAGVNWDVRLMQVQMGSVTEANVITAYTYPLVMRRLYNQTGGARGAFVVATNSSWGQNGGQASSRADLVRDVRFPRHFRRAERGRDLQQQCEH